MKRTNVVQLRPLATQAHRDLLRILAQIERGEITGAYAILSYPDGRRRTTRIGNPLPCLLMESLL